MKRLIVVLLIGLIMFGCTQPEPTDNTTNQTQLVGLGDTVTVDYILRDDNGTIIDQSKNPMTFKVEENNGLIKGFTYALMGKQEGDHFNATIDPEFGYGLDDPDKHIYQKFNYTLPLVQWEENSKMQDLANEQNISLEPNESFEYTSSIKAYIINVTTSRTWFKLNLTVNQSFSWNNFKQKVLEVNDNNATIKFDVEDDQVILLTNPKSGDTSLKRGTIRYVNETTFMIDFEQNPLVGKELYFEMWVREIK